MPHVLYCISPPTIVYNNSTVKLAMRASSHAFGVRVSAEMWVLLFFITISSSKKFYFMTIFAFSHLPIPFKNRYLPVILIRIICSDQRSALGRRIIPAGTGIHCGDEHKTGWKRMRTVDSGDRHFFILYRLAQGIQGAAGIFGKFGFFNIARRNNELLDTAFPGRDHHGKDAPAAPQMPV